jgi:TolB-like protein
MKSDSSPSAAAATPNIRLTREDSLRIAAVVKAQLLKSMRGSPRQAGGVANVDSLQSVLMRAYTDSAIRHAREALRQAGLSEVAGLMAAESVAARLRDSRSHPPTGPSVGGPSRPPTPPRTSRLTTPAKKPPTFARPRRVAILPVRNGTQRPELAAMARMLTDSLRATLVAAGYTPVSDAELLQFLVSPDMSSQRRLADSLGVGAVITSFVSTRGDEALAQSLVLDVWRGIPVSVRAAADLDKPQDAVAVIRDVLRALERVSWRSRVDAKRVLVFDIDNQTGSDSLDNIARQLTTTLRTTIAERLGAIVAADSQSQATKDILERRSVGSRLGAGAIVAGSLYGARGETMIVRLSIRDMSDDRTLPNVDARIPRGATSEQLGPIVEAVIAQLGQINWGPRSDKK